MRGFNKVIIAGNLTADPEVRYLENDKAVANFTVAINNSWTDKDGERHEDCEFVNVVSWRNVKAIADYMKKGSPVLIPGRLKTDKYEKDGQTRYITKVVADNVNFLPSEGSHTNTNNSSGTQNSNSFRDNFDSNAQGDMPDDIPF